MRTLIYNARMNKLKTNFTQNFTDVRTVAIVGRTCRIMPDALLRVIRAVVDLGCVVIVEERTQHFHTLVTPKQVSQYWAAADVMTGRYAYHAGQCAAGRALCFADYWGQSRAFGFYHGHRVGGC